MAEQEQLPVGEARAGDADAWDRLFRRYQLPLYAFVMELVHDEQTALDIVQETFIRAARYIGQLRRDDRFGSWLFGIAHQRCVQRWRLRDRLAYFEADAEGEADQSAPDGLVESVIRREEEAAVLRLIERLPWPQRSVLMLHCLEDFSLEAIAEITGVSVGTVKSRLHYARKQLKQWLEERL